MRTRIVGTLSALGAVALVATAMPTALAHPDETGHTPNGHSHKHADAHHKTFESPFMKKQTAKRLSAVRDLVEGRATLETAADGKKVIKVGSDTFVEYETSRTAKIFTLPTEFGTKIKEDIDGMPGPLHNEIAEPDRTKDNRTIWEPDFSRDYFQKLLFSEGQGDSFRDFYKKQSNGRFDATGEVQDWVKVEYNEARYGYNGNEREGYWSYIEDSIQAWYDAQIASGKTKEEVAEYAKSFDRWDRYDFDGDGVFNEPDGYMDHFQSIHAGEDESAGGGAQGENAIWAHRWYVNADQAGQTGPEGNLLGGAQIGDTGIWVGDYQVNPENGGLGVFAHEFGHDLGLPDLYDTSRGGENGTGFWTLMSSGSWLGPGANGAGAKPNYMGPWEKLQLGWLDYTEITPEQGRQQVKIGPADLDGEKTAQALMINLGTKDKVTELTKPRTGEYEWWTGSGDNLNNTLTRDIDLTGKSSADVTAWISNDIEEGYDYLVAQVSTDGGNTWERIGDKIEGTSDWTRRTFDLSAFAGQKVTFQFFYYTDGGVAPMGGFIDDLTITADGEELFTDGAEDGDNGWTADGFSRTTGTNTEQVPHYYLVENRRYYDYDKYMKTGPYYFPNYDENPGISEYFPYRDGLLVWYCDGGVPDNNTSVHPGTGQALPVDAHPDTLKYDDGQVLRNRLQAFDAAFSLFDTRWQEFGVDGKSVVIPNRPGNSVFKDIDPNAYWREDNPTGSTKVAGSGLTMKLVFPLLYRAYSVVEVDWDDAKN